MLCRTMICSTPPRARPAPAPLGLARSPHLDNHVVGPMHVKLDLRPRVAVAETELGLLNVRVVDALVHLRKVQPDSADQLRNHAGVDARQSHVVLDLLPDPEVGDSDLELGLLGGLHLGHVGLEEGLEQVVHDPLGHRVDVLKRILC